MYSWYIKSVGIKKIRLPLNCNVQEEFTHKSIVSVSPSLNLNFIVQPDVMSGPRSGRAESKESDQGWWLTTDLVYNCTVREEFTYTHAPSVSLCLSILKLHTEHSSLHR